MTTSSTTGILPAFVYAEALEDETERSLGYRLLEPVPSQRWSGEIETLARWLQNTPYPDHWPAVDLFCSLLLQDRQRMVAVVRYGVEDHTSSHRRGGLELIGVLTPAELEPTNALRVYRWLRHRRTSTTDPHELVLGHSLEQILAAAPPDEQPPSLPVLPIRGWEQGCFLFTAQTPTTPDERLGLLEQTNSPHWQWLPLCPGDFPLPRYAERGPLLAWTPQLLEVGVQIDRRPPPPPPPPPRRWSGTLLALLVVLILLLAGNLWTLWTLPARLHTSIPQEAKIDKTARKDALLVLPRHNEDREELAQALYQLLQKETGGLAVEQRLLQRYEQLATQDPRLRVDSNQARAMIGLLSWLARYDADRIAELVRQSIHPDEGYDRKLIELISERVRAHLQADMNKQIP